MSRSTAMRHFSVGIFLCMALTLTLPQAFAAKQKAPKVTEDGLELKKETRQRVVYVRPGATLPPYNTVAILDPYIEFSKDWLRDYNNSQRDPNAKVSDDDLERAKTFLSAEFKKTFSEELAKSGYQISDTAGQGMLILRPALINIRVSAPDLMTPGRSTVYAESSGEMTLYLELWDGGTILARVVDAQADSDMYGGRTTSVSNKAAADRILTAWAVELRKKLDLARGKSAES